MQRGEKIGKMRLGFENTNSFSFNQLKTKKLFFFLNLRMWQLFHIHMAKSTLIA